MLSTAKVQRRRPFASAGPGAPSSTTGDPGAGAEHNSAVASAATCFHCGEAVPAGVDLSLEIAGRARPMCCIGCQAVASLIAGQGLERFYTQRTAYAQRPAGEAVCEDWAYRIYDDPSLARQFAERGEDGLIEARLLVGGMTCAACAWLIEHTLRRLPGVREATLNLNRARLDVRLDARATPLSRVFGAVAALGYRVQPWHRHAQRDEAEREYRRDLRRLAVAGVGMMQVGMFAIALHAGALSGISAEYESLLRVVSLLVTGFVVTFSARGFFASAWRHLRHGALVMDLPVALALGLAFAASAIATVQGAGDVYFDSVTMFTFLLLLARFAERRLRYRDALAWQDTEQALPDAVSVHRDGAWRIGARSALLAGDRVLVRAGDTIPIDGRVESGTSAVREDSFSGEALPRRVSPGDSVYAGTVNSDDALELRATGSYADSRLAALQRSIDRARLGKPALAQMADRLASGFIAAVLLAAAVTALIWWHVDASRALWVALSVLVISCPCALSLATPSALANAASALRRAGIIVNGENALESLASSSHALFDKTGTLTEAGFVLRRIETLDSATTAAAAAALAAALQRYSNHPVATAFATRTADPRPCDIRSIASAGVEARLQGRTLRMGSDAFCREIAPRLAPQPEHALYWVALVLEDRPLAWLGLEDRVRREAAAVIARLQHAGLECGLLSGDASRRAARLGRRLGLQRAHTGLSPQDKLAHVAQLQAAGARVLMVGDGLNDAPVLKQADVSIAVAGATDLARAQADFVLETGNLRQVLCVHGMARRTRGLIRQNFAWALGYNALGIPLAAAGWVPPWAAAIGMSLSSLAVVANAARLRRWPLPE